MPPTEHELRLRERLGRLRNLPLLGGARISGELERLQRQIARIGEEATDEEIWRKVELARHDDRPYTLDYVERLLDDWFELHGDRALGDDGAMIAGLGKLDGRTVILVGQQKGATSTRRASRRFGMPNPEGYRKAIACDGARRPARLPGRLARGHARRLSRHRRRAARPGARRSPRLAGDMARLTVPTVACVIGEGGSGGAIAIGVADRVLMQENAIYSVISPEGCAAILWRDAGQAKKAAAAFRPDAIHCLELGVVDEIVPEPVGGAHIDPDMAARLLGQALRESLAGLEGFRARISVASAARASVRSASSPE